MNKLWQIIKHEYVRHVFRRRFLFSLLSLPAIVLVMVAVVFLIGLFTTNSAPLGYVDYSGILENPVREDRAGSLFNPVIAFEPYPQEQKAQAALDAGEIQGYFIIPADYPEQTEIALYYVDEPDGSAQAQFADFLRQNLGSFQDLDPQLSERLESGSLITMTALDGSNETRQDQWYLIFVPYIAGILFIVTVMTSGGYLLQAVVEEKENRTMEIVITSVSPIQLMAGKIIGNIAVGLTQLVIWLLFGWIALRVGGQIWPFLQNFSLPAHYGLVLVLILIPSFVMVAAIMAAIGATMTEAREAQQVSGMFSILIMVPYYLSSMIMMNPNSTLSLILSYFPLTAPITLLMRMAFTSLPTWEIILNIAVLVLFSVLAILFAARAFRLGMLQYGKKLSFKDVLRKSNPS